MAENKSIVPWLGTEPNVKTTCFTCTNKDDDWIVSWDQYNKEFKNDEVLFIMVNTEHRPSRRRGKRVDMLKVCRIY